MNNGNVLSAFKVKKPIVGVLHLKGDSDADVIERTKREIDIYINHGLDGLLVENYYGHYYQVEQVLAFLQEQGVAVPYGVNCLNQDAMCFDLAERFGCSFLQLDSVVGHVKPRDEYTLEAFFKKYRKGCTAHIMGGVRFKYQPVLSQNTVEEDLLVAKGRCDAVCVTQDATGQETSLERIQLFRDCLRDFPLFVCAGVNCENAKAQLGIADGAVIGSYFKDTGKDTGDVCAANVEKLMRVIRELREEC